MTTASSFTGSGIMSRVLGRVRNLVPGVSLLILLAIISDRLATVLPLNALILTIGAGFLIANVYGLPRWAEDGVNTHKVWLETGIVLMGARLTLGRILQTGPKMVFVVMMTVVLTLSIGELLARYVFGLPERLGSLIAAGMSICGVSAVVAVAGCIRAESNQIAYAVAAVLLFDAVTLVTYPLIGQALHLPGSIFGIWAGVSMLSTGPVTAAGFAYSDVAGQWATVTKLTRNAMIGVVAVGYSVYYTQDGGSSDVTEKIEILWNQFPKFILGFLALMTLSSVGAFSSSQIETMKTAYGWLFLVAFAGLGMNIQVGEMTRAGIKPTKSMLLTLLVVSVVSLVVISILF